MNIYVNLFFSILVVLVIITFKILNTKKNHNNYRGLFYRKSLVFNTFLYIIAIFLFAYLFIINLKDHNVIISILNALSIAILFIPSSINTLYKTSFKDEEEFSHLKYVITEDYDAKIVRKLNRAGISIIFLSETYDKAIPLDKLKDLDGNKNVTVNTKDYEEVFRIVGNSAYFEYLSDAYETIRYSRGVHDNYIRTVKFNLAIYGGLFFSICAMLIQGFPLYYNLFNACVFKVLTYLSAEYLYKHLTFDTDIMDRKPKPTNIFLGFQEILISLIEAFCICFALTIPYMYILASGGTINLTYTILTVTLLYSCIWLTYSYLSERTFITNLIKSFKNKKLIIITICMIILTILICFIPKDGFINIGLKNYMSALLISLISIIFIEITKLARYTTTKGIKRNGSKDN